MNDPFEFAFEVLVHLSDDHVGLFHCPKGRWKNGDKKGKMRLTNNLRRFKHPLNTHLKEKDQGRAVNAALAKPNMKLQTSSKEGGIRCLPLSNSQKFNRWSTEFALRNSPYEGRAA